MVEGLTCFRVGTSDLERTGKVAGRPARPDGRLTTERCSAHLASLDKPLGGQSEVEPPVPIPNTAVKHLSADDTEEVAPLENMPLPRGFFLFF